MIIDEEERDNYAIYDPLRSRKSYYCTLYDPLTPDQFGLYRESTEYYSSTLILWALTMH